MSIKSINIPILHSFRGISVLLICFYHYIVTTTGFVDNEMVLEIFHFGRKGVPLFFLISGIVIPLSMIKAKYSYSNFGKFLLKRFIRIEPPYLVAAVVGMAYLYLRNFVPSSNNVDLFPSFRDILLHIGYLIPFVEGAKWINTVFWTLSIEFQYYLFLAVTIPLALSNKKAYIWIFNLLLIGVSFISYRGAYFPNWAAYFSLGVFYTFYITNKLSLTEYLIFTALSFVPIYLHQGLSDLIFGLVIILLTHKFGGFRNKILEFFGKISYSLYLLHTIVGSGFINFMSHRYSSPISVIILTFTGLALSTGAAYLFWRFIEKPSQKASKRIKL